MNVTVLRTFLEVVETGSLSRAADRMNVTQSTVTSRINLLEDQLGENLILRRKSGAEMTSAGFKFKRYAELMLQTWRQAQHEIGLPESSDAILNIGCHYDLWDHVAQNWLDDLHRHHPSVALSVWGGEQTDMDRWLSSGLVDVCLCFSPKVQENALVHTLYDERLILVSTEWYDESYPTPPFLYTDLGESFRRQHAIAFPKAVAPSLIFGTAQFAHDHLVKHGGVGYLPESLAKESLGWGALKPVPEAPVFTRRVYLVANERIAEKLNWFNGSVLRLTGRLREDAGQLKTAPKKKK